MRPRMLLLPVAVLLLTGMASCSGSAAEPQQQGGACTYVASEPAAKQATVPPAQPESVASLTISTNRGDISATLEPASAPCTVNSFVSLASQGYYDATRCHRLVPGFVLQCGDPSASGSGGPGYTFADELTGKETYPAGTLAMANSGPDTNGSQFFIVLADADLPPDYTVFGKVDAAGLQVAQDIEKDGNAADGVAPAKDVIITSVR